MLYPTKLRDSGRLLCGIILFLIVFSTSAFAQQGIATVATGNWNDPAVWTGGTLPAANDTAIIHHQVVLDGSLLASVSLGGIRIINSGAVAAAPQLTIANDAVVTVAGDLEVRHSNNFINYGGTLIVQNSSSLMVSGSMYLYSLSGALGGVPVNLVLQDTAVVSTTNFEYFMEESPMPLGETFKEVQILNGATLQVNGDVDLNRQLGFDGVYQLNWLVDHTARVEVANDFTLINDTSTPDSVFVEFRGSSSLHLGGNLDRLDLSYSPGERGKIIFNGQSTLFLEGSIQQSIHGYSSSSSDSVKYRNIVFNNTSGLDSAIRIDNDYGEILIHGNADFISGHLIADNVRFQRVIFEETASTSSASLSSYIKGPVSKKGNAAFTFPAGYADNYIPLRVFNITGGDAATVLNLSFLEDIYGELPALVSRVSKKEGWYLYETSPNVPISGFQVGISSFDAITSGISDLSNIRLAYRDESPYTVANTSFTGDLINGFEVFTADVIAGFPTGYYNFVFASTSVSANPLGHIYLGETAPNVVKELETATAQGAGFISDPTNRLYVGNIAATIGTVTSGEVSFAMSAAPRYGQVNFISDSLNLIGNTFLNLGYKSDTVFDAQALDSTAVLASHAPGTMLGVEVADFNADGFPDFTYIYDNTIYVYTNDGSGTMSQSFTTLIPADVSTMAIGDMNNDGFLDIVYASRNLVLDGTILMNNGSGTSFSSVAFTLLNQPGEFYIEKIALADVNQDGWLDIGYLRRDEISGVFSQSYIDQLIYEPINDIYYSGGDAAISRTSEIKDFVYFHSDANTTIDMAISVNGNLEIIYNADRYNLNNINLGFGQDGKLFVYDYDHNGFNDLLIVGDTGMRLAVNGGLGDYNYYGGFTETISNPVLFLENLEGNGFVDFGIFEGSNFHIMRNLGNGLLSSTGNFPIPSNIGTVSATSADINVDGIPDILFADSSSVQVIYNFVQGANTPAVSNFFVSVSADTATLAWDAVPEADGYIVLRYNSTSGYTPSTLSNRTEYTESQLVGDATVIMRGTATSFTDTGLLPTNTYTYEVIPFVGSGYQIAYSTEATSPLNATIQVPVVDTLMWNNATATQVQASWTAYNGVSNYYVTAAYDDAFSNIFINNQAVADTTVLLDSIRYSTQIYVKLMAESNSVLGNESQTFSFKLPISTRMESDSLVLVALYDALDGNNWTDTSGWKSTRVENWFGVTVQGDSVIALDLSGNNLSGVVPAELGNLKIAEFRFGGNNITGFAPTPVQADISPVTLIDLSYNQLDSVPDFGFTNLQTFNLEGNRLSFQFLEPNASIPNFTYTPQLPLIDTLRVYLDAGDSTSLDAFEEGQNNTYQWFANGVQEAGLVNASRMVVAPDIFFTNYYWAEVSNTSLPDLTYMRKVFVVELSPSSRDSLALVALYESTNGANWINPWDLSQPISTWSGISLDSVGAVTAIDLSGRGLGGGLPVEMLEMKALTTLNLADNRLTFIQDFTAMPQLTSIDVRNNRIGFDPIISNLALAGFLYTPQAPFSPDEDVPVFRGTSKMFILLAGSAGAVYQWTKDGLPIANSDTSHYSLGEFLDASKNGVYQGSATHPLVPDLTLYTGIKNVYLSTSSITEYDSLALISLYEATGGSNWNDPWDINGLASNWSGVSDIYGSVVELNLNNRNLSGSLPQEINNLLYSDGESGPFNLERLYLANNELEGISNLNGQGLLELDISGNLLTIDQLEQFVGVVPTYTYAPQNLVYEAGTVYVQEGESTTLRFTIPGSSNQYQWIKDGVDIAGANADSLQLEAVVVADEGDYALRVTNTLLPDLEVLTEAMRVRIPSLERDSLALRLVYEGLNGANWSTRWDLTQPINTWAGVEITEGRVTALNLGSNNLSGEVPEAMNDIRYLRSVNLSSNTITGLPTLTLDSLIAFDVSNNRLSYEDIISNVNQTGLLLGSQALIGAEETILLAQGSPTSVSISTPGTGNIYTWTRNGNIVANANASTLLIDSLTYDNMGNYQCEVGNTVVNAVFPDFRLLSSLKTVLATAQITGNLINTNNQTVNAAEVFVFQVNPTGKYDTVRVEGNISTPVGSDGTFVLNDVVLGDYLLLADPDETSFPNLIPSYYKGTIDWDLADVMSLRKDTLGNEIVLQGEPAIPQGTSRISGILEEDVPDSGRLLARSRLSGSGVSVRKDVGQNRGQQEFTLVAYVETDENGEFVFPDLEPGTYQIRVEYPGVPMDVNSDVIFEVGDYTSREVLATVVDGAITVETLRVLGLNRPEQLSGLQVYPNPSEGMVQVQILQSIIQGFVEVIDSNGRLVMNQVVESNTTSLSLDLSKAPKGLYIIRLRDGEKVLGLEKLSIR